MKKNTAALNSAAKRIVAALEGHLSGLPPKERMARTLKAYKRVQEAMTVSRRDGTHPTPAKPEYKPQTRVAARSHR